MPLAVGTGTIITPPPVIIPPQPVDLPSATWIDPYGVAWPLTDTSRERGYFTPVGVAGISDAVPLTISADALDGGGEEVRYIYPGPRLVTWPLYIEGGSHAEFLGRWRQLVRAFTSTSRRGPGTLQIARPDGSVRQIAAYYSDGFDGDPTMQGIRYDLPILTLRCPDGYWQDVDPQEITRTGGGAGSSFLSPFMTVSSSAVLGATTVVNPGDVPAYPVWTITGPCSSFTATNLDTGESWTLDPVAYRGTALLSTETVIVQTRPMAVTGPDGSSWFGALAIPDAVLWGIDEGSVDISFAATGSTSATTIVGTYIPRYETA